MNPTEDKPKTYKCPGCRNTVGSDHTPYSPECDEDKLERDLAQREW
jgi:hypothetical protein